MLRHITQIAALSVVMTSAALAEEKLIVDDAYCRQGLQCHEDGKCYGIGQSHPKNPDKLKCVFGSGPSEDAPCEPHWGPINVEEICKKAQPLTKG